MWHLSQQHLLRLFGFFFAHTCTHICHCEVQECVFLGKGWSFGEGRVQFSFFLPNCCDWNVRKEWWGLRCFRKESLGLWLLIPKKRCGGDAASFLHLPCLSKIGREWHRPTVWKSKGRRLTYDWRKWFDRFTSFIFCRKSPKEKKWQLLAPKCGGQNLFLPCGPFVTAVSHPPTIFFRFPYLMVFLSFFL